MALHWRHVDTDPKQRNISQPAASLCMCNGLNTAIQRPPDSFILAGTRSPVFKPDMPLEQSMVDGPH